MDNRHLAWERAVLGTALTDPATVEVANELLPSDFSGQHQTLWAEILALHQRESLDMRLLTENLRERRQLELLGGSDVNFTGEDYLSYLLSFRGQTMEAFAERVENASVKRQLKRLGALIIADAESENIDAKDAADQAEQRLLSLRRNRGRMSGMSLGDVMRVFLTRVEGMRDGTIQPAWVPPIEALTRVVHYVDQEDFVILAGRPGMGKSSTARYFLAKASISGAPTLMFNLENSETEYAKFTISMVTGIDSAKLKSPRLLTRDELRRVHEAANSLAQIPFYIETLGAPSAKEIDRIVRTYLSKGIKLICVDYLQLVQNGISSSVENITYTSNLLRAIPLNYKVPVIGVSQLSREIVHRGDNAAPQLSDLRGSGSLEQDATQVWFPHRVWSNPTEVQLRMFPQNLDEHGNLYPNPKAVPIKMHVAKNRNGEIGASEPYLWVMSTNNFFPLTEVEQ